MQYLTAILVFVITYTVYALTWPPTVFWQDAGIFMAAIKTLGIAYPPGFPLYVMLGHLWTLILPWGNFAQKVHAFSSLWGAGTAGVMALIAWDIFHLRGGGIAPLKRGKGHLGGVLISLTTGLTTAFSYSLWAQSINAEVYSLHAFFTAMFLYFVVKLYHLRGLPCRQGTIQDRFDSILDRRNWRQFLHLERDWGLWFFLFLTTGLSFANHPLALTLLITLGYLVYQKKEFFSKRKMMLAFLSLILFLSATLPYLYLPIRAAAKPELNWGDPSTPIRLIKHITGSGYLSDEQAFILWDFEKLKSFLFLFWEEFFAVPILLGLVGFYLMFKKDKILFKLLSVLALLVLALTYFYSRGSEYNFWLIPFYLVFILAFANGLREIFHLGGGIASPPREKPALFLISAIGFFSLAPLLLVNWSYLDRSNYYLPLDFGKNILRPLESNSILFILGDQPSSTVLYLQQVEDYRNDVAVIVPGDILENFNQEQIKRQYPNIKFPKVDDKNYDRIVNEFVDLNPEPHAIYFPTLKLVPSNFKYPLIAAGAFWKVSKDENEVVDEKYWDFQFSNQNFVQMPMKKEASKKITLANGEIKIIRTTYHQDLIEYLSQALKNLGDWYFVRGDCQNALRAYERIFDYQKDFSHPVVLENLRKCKKT